MHLHRLEEPVVTRDRRLWYVSFINLKSISIRELHRLLRKSGVLQGSRFISISVGRCNAASICWRFTRDSEVLAASSKITLKGSFGNSSIVSVAIIYALVQSDLSSGPLCTKPFATVMTNTNSSDLGGISDYFTTNTWHGSSSSFKVTMFCALSWFSFLILEIRNSEHQHRAGMIWALLSPASKDIFKNPVNELDLW